MAGMLAGDPPSGDGCGCIGCVIALVFIAGILALLAAGIVAVCWLYQHVSIVVQ